jgi:hypothetical protein
VSEFKTAKCLTFLKLVVRTLPPWWIPPDPASPPFDKLGNDECHDAEPGYKKEPVIVEVMLSLGQVDSALVYPNWVYCAVFRMRLSRCRGCIVDICRNQRDQAYYPGHHQNDSNRFKTMYQHERERSGVPRLHLRGLANTVMKSENSRRRTAVKPALSKLICVEPRTPRSCGRASRCGTFSPGCHLYRNRRRRRPA